ncbi:MAG: SGNH/GDSL hydrolase family protein [Candidatus Omnitrophica bacterium]|nr:SGNH/GDSL hydrolase family protein [Candidatus Omnitrophota bacterium]
MREISKAKKALFVLVLLIISFLCIEIFVRVAYYAKYHNIDYLTAPFERNFSKAKKPVIYKTYMDYFEGYYKYKPGDYFNNEIPYRINKDGFRNREIKEKRSYRIICFGGSTTACLESQDGETWPRQLELLNDYEVINMGMSGYDSSSIYNLLTKEAYKYEPDLILLYFGRNDLHHNINRRIRLDKPYKRFFFKLHNKIYYTIMSYTYIVEKLSLIKQSHPNPAMFYPYEPCSKFLDNFNKILDFCKEKDIGVIYICQVKNPKSDATKLYKLQGTVEEICKERDITFIKTRPEFFEKMDKEEFFANNGNDPIHLTPSGNKALAEIISEKLKRINKDVVAGK